MLKKIVISFLLVAIFNLLVGCYSSELITASEYNQIEENDKPDAIRLSTKDSQEYHFSKSNVYIENDTLWGKGEMIFGSNEKPFEGKFAITEIKSIQIESLGSYPVPKKLSISEFQRIEEETGEPDKIFLTKIDFTYYHFMKPDYYIEDDTLYGKGKSILPYKKKSFEGKIALSDIVSIEVENFNLTNTILLGLGIAAISFVILVVILAASGKFGYKGG
jgi:hypothetical protein